MNDIHIWYEQLLAQLAADSYLDSIQDTGFDFENEELLKQRLGNGANHYAHIDELIAEGKSLSATRMTQVMAQDFIDTWEVIDHLPNTASGFSATVLKKKGEDEYTLSFRSTESKDADDGGDVERDSSNGANGQIKDLGFAWGQLRDMEKYFADLKQGALASGSEADGTALSAWLADPNKKLNVTGYSLGGHLAQAFTLIHDEEIEHTYTFNGAGFGAIEGIDPSSELGAEIVDRLYLIDDVMANPYAYLDDVSESEFEDIGYSLTLPGHLLPVSTKEEALAQLLLDRDVAIATSPESGIESLYDDPLFQFAIRALPGDTVGALDISVFGELAGFGVEQITANDKITNLFGSALSGTRFLDNVVAGSGQLTGAWVPVYIEDQPLVSTQFDLSLSNFNDSLLRSFGPTHSIALIADSLAVMDLYTTLDPSLATIDPNDTSLPGDVKQPGHRLNRLFDVMTNNRANLLELKQGEGNTLETALDALGRLIVGDAWEETPSSDAPGAYGSLDAREKFYPNVEILRHAIRNVNDELYPAYAGLTITALVDIDASTLAARAANDIAYRYALRELNPFVVTGNAAIYDQHNTPDAQGTGILDLEQFSASYLFDRAQFLVGVVTANERSNSLADDSPFVLTTRNIDYGDDHTGTVLHEVTASRLSLDVGSGEFLLNQFSSGSIPKVRFSNTETVSGANENDRLYGEHGNNEILGLAGEDLIEGGGGDDALFGNDKSNADDMAADILRGGLGTDVYFANALDVIEDTDGLGGVVFGQRLLSDGYREAGDSEGAYTSEDGYFTYNHDELAARLTVWVNKGDPNARLTINNFQSGHLSIGLNENPQPTDTQFEGSAGADTITVNLTGTEISGVIDGNAINPVETFTPNVEVIAALGGDDLITVQGDVENIRIHGDNYVAGAADDGHDDIAIDVDRVSTGVVPTVVEAGARVYGGGGNDRISGGLRSDELLGEAGNDRISGNFGDDRISGGEDDPDPAQTDNDVLTGEFGDDELFGHRGDDALFGGQGADTLAGGSGNDTLYGDLITWGYHIADFSTWSGPSNMRNDGGVYTATGGTGAVLATPNVAGDHVVFDAAVGVLAGNDNLDGGAGDDHLLGGHGDDHLDGGADRDLLEGEEGDDTLLGGSGNDILYGDISPTTFENHSAVLSSGTAPDGNWTLSFREFLGGANAGGNDALDGGADTDTLFGGVGDDTLDGGRFDHAIDVLYGGADNDDYVFGFGDGRTFVYDDDGGADRVVFRAGVSPDDVHFEPDDTGSSLIISLTLNGVDIGDELIISNWYLGNTVESFVFDGGLTWTSAFVEAETGRSINDTDPVDNGEVVLVATDQADVSLGSSGNDEAYVLAGDDRFAGGGGNDRIFGGDGDDEIQGNEGDDFVSGETGNDRLYGQAGSDSLYGGAGDDDLSGGGGADVLIGGPGADNLLGGLDNDTYRFDRGDGDDFIRDDGGTTDRIVFGADITTNDVTVDASGNSIILDVRTNGDLVGDRITIVDGLSNATEIEAIEFADSSIWSTADITARLPDAHALDDGVDVTGGANVTTYTLATELDDGFTIDITDTGGIDTLDLKAATSPNGTLTPVLNSTSRSGNDLLIDVTVDSTISSIPDATGEIRINGFYTGAGFVETIRFGAAEMNTENAAPLVAIPPVDTLITLDSPYTFAVPSDTFTDSAFDKLLLSATLADGGDLPAWLTFDAATGTFSGTPASGDAAIIEIAITATDTKGLTATTGYALNVGNVNVAPVLAVPVISQSANEGSAFSYALPAGTFADVNPGDTLAVSAQLASGDPLPSWLTFDDQTNTFSGTPATADVGLQLVEVTATDGGSLAATDIFTITVDYLNDAPTVAVAPSDQRLTEQQAFSYTLPAGTFTDSDSVHGDTLDYTLSMQNGTALPGWLSFDAETLTLSGRPVGIFADTDIDVRVTATDNDGASTNADVRLEVTDVAGAAAWYVPHDTTGIGSSAYSRSGSVTAALNDGGYVVVWESGERDGDERGIYAQRYKASGTALGSAIRVNTTTTEDQRALTVAALVGGGFVVSWVSLHEDDGFQVPPSLEGGGVYAQQFSASGAPVGGEKQVSEVRSGIQNQTAIAALSDGGYMITWFSQFDEQRINNGEYGIGDPGFFGRRYSAAGAETGGRVRLTDVGVSDLQPSVAGLLGGGFVLAWNGVDTDTTGVRAQRYFSGGSKNGPEILVNSWVDDRQSDPQVAALATGGFVVIWRSEDQDFSGGGVYGQRYSNAGARLGSEFRVNTTTLGSQGDPAVSATPDGGFVVSWVSGAMDGIGDIYAQQYDVAGMKVGSEALIDASGFRNDAPSVTALADGSLVHTWTATDAGGVSTDPNDPWALIGPTRIESKRIELRANTPLEVLRPTVALEGSEFKSVIYRVEDHAFFDPDVRYGDSITFDATLADGSPLPAWLGFDDTTATLSGLPLSAQVGTVDVRITAADLSGAVGESIVTITIGAAAEITVTAAPATYTVNSVEPLSNRDPDAVVLAGGDRIVVWHSGTEVRGRRFAPDGTSDATEFRIDTAGLSVGKALVTALADGGFAVAWRRSGGAIHARRYDAAGVPTAGEVELIDASVTGVHDFAIAGLTHGGFVLSWSTDGIGNNDKVLSRHFDDSAVPSALGADITVSDSAAAGEGIDVAALVGGDYVLSWSESNGADEQIVVARRFATNGTAAGSTFQVNNANGLTNDDPAVAGLADGGLLVTWTAGDGLQDDVYARLFDADGVARGDAWRVNNYTNSEQRDSTAAATNDGGFVVAWHSDKWTVPNEYGFMQAQHFDRHGNPTGDFFAVGFESTMRETGPVITASADGGFDLVWASDHAADGAGTDSIKGQHFRIGGSVPNLLPAVSAPIADQTIGEDVPYSFFVPADTIVDPDGAAITYRATLAGGIALPGWLNFNTETRAFNGTPGNADVGNYAITVVGSDPAGGVVAESFTLTVSNVNDPPAAVDDIVGLRIDVGDKTLVLDVLANDSDIDPGDKPTTFSLDAVTVAGGLGSATIVGNQLRFDAGTDFDYLAQREVRQVDVQYTMSDMAGSSSTAVATVAIYNGEVVVSDNASTVVSVTAPTAFFGPGTFSFGSGSSGSKVNIGSGFGPGTTTVKISDQTGSVGIGRSTGSGIPGRGVIDVRGLALNKSKISVGSMVITFEGTDVEIHIEDFDRNDVFADDPVIDTFLFNGIAYTYREFVSRGFDLDGTANADAISGTNAVDRILGFGADDTLFGGDGDDTLTGGPGDDFLDGGDGNDTYVFAAGDGHDVIADAAGIDRIVFASGLTSADAVSTRIGRDLQMTLNARDSVTLRNWYLGPQHRVETFAFAHDKLRIVDSDTAETIHENHAPTVAEAPADQNAIAGDPFSYRVQENSFTDVDLDNALTYSANRGDGLPLPSWLVFDANNREFSGTPASGDIGSLTVRITATDTGGLSVSDTFSVSVAAAPGQHAPTISGTALDDVLTGTAFADKIFGLAGNDEIDGGASDDLIFAGTGDDRVVAMGGNNEIHGGSNDDSITTGAGDDAIYGNRHDDTIDAGDGGNTVYGGQGNDYIVTGTGADRVDGGRGNDRINPGRGDDIVFGGRGRDTIVDLHGNNAIHGGANNDTITTGAGDDTIYGGRHNDRIDAGDGADRLFGGRGPDTLFGGAGDDRLAGGSGADFIRGGRGDDVLIGGRGGDTYHFDRLDGVDVVMDSNSNHGDTIEFGQSIAADQIWFSRAGNDLRLNLGGTTDTVFVRDWYTRGATIERFELDDGSYLVDSDVDQLVQAMAAFGLPEGSETSLPQHIAQDIAPVIAAVWQSPA